MKSSPPGGMIENGCPPCSFQCLHDLCLVCHLKNLRTGYGLVAVAVNWGIAFFEYLVQVPANRIGYGRFSLFQLKIIQEVLTLAVFVHSWSFTWDNR